MLYCLQKAVAAEYMKSRLLRTGIGSIIFLLLVVAVFAVLQPIYKGVSAVLNQHEYELLDMLSDKTGLGISYTSLSPSILSGIRVKGIEVYDVSSKKNILSVQKVVLRYRLITLLKGDFENAFTGLTVTGVDFDFNSTENTQVIEKIEALAGTDPKKASSQTAAAPAADQSTSGSGLLLSQEVTDTLKQTLFSLPFSIRIRKVVCHYKNESLSLDVGLNDFQLKKKLDGNSLSSKLSGYVRMSVSPTETAGFSYTINGQLLHDISGSSALCRLYEYSKADYTIGKGEYLFRYNNRQLVLQSLQNLQPFSLRGSLNIDTGDVTADVKMEHLNPFSVLKVRNPNDGLKMVAGTKVTSDVSLSYNIPGQLLSWQAFGSLVLSQHISASGERLSFNMSGDNESINIASLEAVGELASGSFSGTYHIPTMQPTGTLVLDHYLLPNGNAISGELYLDALDKGFFCFIPQLFLGSETLTALQLTVVPRDDSFEFSFDMNDYSHADFDTPGDLKVDGSLTLGKTQYLQASVDIGNIFLDTVMRIAAVFVDKKSMRTMNQIAVSLAPYIFTNELYFSTDFKSISFNSPYSVIANTQQEKQLLLLSFDGNESSVQVSQLDLIYGNQTVQASLEADISAEDKEVIFNSDCMVNSLPYHFSGNYRDGKWLGITGDYGLDVAINLDNSIDGTVKLSSFPIAINSYIISLSTDLSISSSRRNGLFVNIDRFELEEVSGKLSIRPKIAFTGMVNNEGLVLSSLSYTDTISSLDGSGQFLWNINDGIFDSLTAELKVANPLSTEAISLSGNFTNPTHAELDQSHLMNDCYFTADVDITSFAISRFIAGQLPDDTLSAVVSASGTASNPYVSVNMSGLSVQFSGLPLIAKGAVVVEDKVVTVPEMDLEWSGMKISNTHGDFDLSSFNGVIGAQFDLSFGGKTMYAPFTVTITNKSPSSAGAAPENFDINVDSNSITGTLLNEPLPVHLLCRRTKGRMDISSDETLGVSGWSLDDGSLFLKVREDKPIHFVMEGKTEGQFINFNCKNIFCDLSRISFLVNSDFFSVYQGIVSGNLTVSGLGTDPDFDGSLAITNAEFNMPNYVPEHITAVQILCNCNQDEINIPETPFLIKDTTFKTRVHVVLDRWSFDSLEAHLVSEESKGIPIDVNIPFLRIKGDTGMNVGLSLTNNSCDINGSISLQNSEITAMTNLSNLSDYTSNGGSTGSPMDFNINLNLLVGQRVQIILNPILRGLVAPQTPITFNLNSAEGTWNLKGDVVLRGGEVTYLSRNFYLKEGRIVLNETQNSFDPNLTIRAETRERDENGDPVTISLSAIRQNASHFSPQLTSSPAKSENEIMALLGQIVTADANEDGRLNVSNILFAGLDFGVQVTLLRKGEDALRDLLNFDILSMRTMLLQNALKQGLNTTNKDAANMYSFGNYFDNSTVYIGKYFGSALYADALLQWTYDSSKYQKDNPVSGIMFQPELGFELSSPFANIRWSFAPDLGSAFTNSWVPATSITLSWKLSF